jgi:hypothetical protein
MDKIQNRIQEHYDIVAGRGHEVVGVFLQGSQNYNLHYDGSDIDSKAILLPKFNDFVLNKSPISTTSVLENNEHIDLKDIRLMFDCFRKQNINFVEILFTQYKVLNPKYADLFQSVVDTRELIARYNNYASVNCMAGMSLEKYKAMEHPYPTIIDKIEKYGYDPKQLHHIIRLYEFLQRYIDGESYDDCLISKRRDYMIEVKKACYSLDEARIIAKELTDKIVKIKNVYMQNNCLYVNKDCENILNNTLVEIMKYNFKTELSNKI